jgi:phosphatidylethanolamine N-methyltransferase
MYETHAYAMVGYAGYYGLSLIVGSYLVLFASLAAHAAQFAFLAFFENPRESPPLPPSKYLSSRALICF